MRVVRENGFPDEMSNFLGQIIEELNGTGIAHKKESTRSGDRNASVYINADRIATGYIDADRIATGCIDADRNPGSGDTLKSDFCDSQSVISSNFQHRKSNDRNFFPKSPSEAALGLPDVASPTLLDDVEYEKFQ